jgi:hypothetical protein
MYGEMLVICGRRGASKNADVLASLSEKYIQLLHMHIFQQMVAGTWESKTAGAQVSLRETQAPAVGF